jgi:hypothetical protein
MTVQLRSSRILSLSGSLADCIAFGVPTVTTEELALEHGAPAYVASVECGTTSLLLADAVEPLLDRRRTRLTELERERRAYLDVRSGDRYARDLLAALGLAP